MAYKHFIYWLPIINLTSASWPVSIFYKKYTCRFTSLVATWLLYEASDSIFKNVSFLSGIYLQFDNMNLLSLLLSKDTTSFSVPL